MTRWLAVIAAVCAGFGMVIAVVDVIGAKFFSWSLPGAKGFIEELMVLVIFLAIAHTERQVGHFRINVLERFISAGQIYPFRLVVYVIGMLVTGFLGWRALALLQYTIAVGLTKEVGISFPLWPSVSAVFLGFGFLTITFFLLLSKEIIAVSKR